MPERVQLRRKAGWRMPSNTVSVARPTKWGNPYRVGGRYYGGEIVIETVHDAVAYFKIFMQHTKAGRKLTRDAKAELKGKNLACWCPASCECHADYLMRIANE